MGDGTGIEWTDATWNPVRGCSRKSPGCMGCYAEVNREVARRRAAEADTKNLRSALDDAVRQLSPSKGGAALSDVTPLCAEPTDDMIRHGCEAWAGAGSPGEKISRAYRAMINCRSTVSPQGPTEADRLRAALTKLNEDAREALAAIASERDRAHVLLALLWREGAISEGQVAKALGIDLIAWREICGRHADAQAALEYDQMSGRVASDTASTIKVRRDADGIARRVRP